MGGKRRTIRLIHLIRISVVRCNQCPAPHRQNLIHHFAQAGIHRFYRRNRRFKHAGMADHVAVGKV